MAEKVIAPCCSIKPLSATLYYGIWIVTVKVGREQHAISTDYRVSSFLCDCETSAYLCSAVERVVLAMLSQKNSSARVRLLALT